MRKYDFQVILAGVEEITEEISNALYEAGCDDGTPFSTRGVAAVGFTREANSLEEAVRSAIADIKNAGFTVARVESPDQPVFSRINEELAKR
jgi:hypothetical protein